MGCIYSKRTAHREGYNNNHPNISLGGKVIRLRERGASLTNVTRGAHPTPNDEGEEMWSFETEKTSNGSSIDRPVDSIVKKHPPKALKRLFPLNPPCLSNEMLREKQRRADVQREAAVHRNRDVTHNTSLRGDQMWKRTHSDGKFQTFQIQTHIRPSDLMREVKHKEIVDRQRLSEERMRNVREKKNAVENQPLLTTDILLAKQRAADRIRAERLKRRREFSQRYPHILKSVEQETSDHKNGESSIKERLQTADRNPKKIKFKSKYVKMKVQNNPRFTDQEEENNRA